MSSSRMALSSFSFIHHRIVIFASLIFYVVASPLSPSSCEFHSTGKQLYAVGESWEVRVGSQKDFQCMNCTCLPVSLSVQCLPLAEKRCPDLDDCLKIVDVPNACCPVCTEVRNQLNRIEQQSARAPVKEKTVHPDKKCIHNGIVYQEGERWSPESNTTAVRPHHTDQCVQCECQSSHTICYLKMCPTYACKGMTISTQDNCCPVCEEMLPSINSRNLPVADAATYEISNGVSENDFDPYTELADEENQECISGPEKYENGAQWHPIIPPFGRIKCVVCECEGGQIHCKRPACPEKLPCSRTITKPGQCCPVCDESNEIVNVTATGTFLCVRNGDYLVYENLHGGTVEILLRLPEEDMLWKHTWKMGTNTAEVSTTELKLWEFKRLHSAENYRLLGVSRPRKVSRFSRRMNKIRHTCHQRCSKRVERLVQVLQIQTAQSGRKAECPEKSRPVNTQL